MAPAEVRRVREAWSHAAAQSDARAKLVMAEAARAPRCRVCSGALLFRQLGIHAACSDSREAFGDRAYSTAGRRLKTDPVQPKLG